jgi:hypothetical protein
LGAGGENMAAPRDKLGREIGGPTISGRPTPKLRFGCGACGR